MTKTQTNDALDAALLASTTDPATRAGIIARMARRRGRARMDTGKVPRVLLTLKIEQGLLDAVSTRATEHGMNRLDFIIEALRKATL